MHDYSNVIVSHKFWIFLKSLNFRALKYMFLNFFARFFVAVTQLYAISIFTNIHNSQINSVIILLFGYMIWFQLFDLGLTQTIQNRFNLKKIKIKNITIIIISHYLLILFVGLLNLKLNIFSVFLLNNIEYSYTNQEKFIFDLGCSILLLSSNNIMIHRLLIVYRKSYLSNRLLFLQSLLVCSILFFYKTSLNPNPIVSIVLFFVPQILITLPFIIKLSLKLIKEKKKKYETLKPYSLVKYSSSFLFISFLSSFLLGLDYLVISYFSNSDELLSYHLTVRFYYFSFMMYYGYIIFAAKNIGKISNEQTNKQILKVKRHSVIIGVFFTICVYIIIQFLNTFGFLDIITNGIKINQNILFVAFIYYVIRVFADTRIIIAQNLSEKINLIKLYSLQIFISLVLMPPLCYYFGGVGVLLSLSFSYICGFTVKLEKK